MARKESIWPFLAIVGGAIATAAFISGKKDPVGGSQTGTAQFVISDGGAIIRDGGTPTSLDEISLSNNLLNATITIPDDLGEAGKQTLSRLQQILTNKSISFKVERYLRVSAENFALVARISQVDPSEIILDHKLLLGLPSVFGVTISGHPEISSIPIRIKSSPDGALELKNIGIDAGVFSSLENFASYIALLPSNAPVKEVDVKLSDTLTGQQREAVIKTVANAVSTTGRAVFLDGASFNSEAEGLEDAQDAIILVSGQISALQKILDLEEEALSAAIVSAGSREEALKRADEAMSFLESQKNSLLSEMGTAPAPINLRTS